jgi:hypothetical protein
MSGIIQVLTLNSGVEGISPPYPEPAILLDIDAAYFTIPPPYETSITGGASYLTQQSNQGSLYFGGNQVTGGDTSWLGGTGDMTATGDFTVECFMNPFSPSDRSPVGTPGFPINPIIWFTAVTWPSPLPTITSLTSSGTVGTMTYATRPSPPYIPGQVLQFTGQSPSNFAGNNRTVLTSTLTQTTFSMPSYTGTATVLGTVFAKVPGINTTVLSNKSDIFTIGDETTGRITFYTKDSNIYYSVFGDPNPVLMATSVFKHSTGNYMNDFNVWKHIAIVRSGSTITTYSDGIAKGTVTLNGTLGNANGFYIGNGNSNGANGTLAAWAWMSNIRYVKDVAVYTGTFTVPTDSLTVTATANPYGGSNTSAISAGQTNLLINNSPAFTGSQVTLTDVADTSSYSNPITRNGTAPPSWQGITPFSTNNARFKRGSGNSSGNYANGTITLVPKVGTTGGYFNMAFPSTDGTLGTNQALVAPDFTGPSWSQGAVWSMFYVYRVPVLTGGRFINNNVVTPEIVLGAFNNKVNTFYFSTSPTNPSSPNDQVWHFNWLSAVGQATTNQWTFTCYSATSSQPTGVFATVNSGTSYSTAWNGIRIWGKSDGYEMVPGDIGLVKVYNTALTLTDVQGLYNNYKVRFGY